MPSYRERFVDHPSPSPAEVNMMEENAMDAGMENTMDAGMENTMDAGVENTMDAGMENNDNASVENFANLKMGKFPVDLVLKAIFFGAIFYLLSLPEVYKMTKKCCKAVDGVLLHSVVFAILYFVLSQFIN